MNIFSGLLPFIKTSILSCLCRGFIRRTFYLRVTPPPDPGSDYPLSVVTGELGSALVDLPFADRSAAVVVSLKRFPERRRKVLSKLSFFNWDLNFVTLR